MDKRQVIAEVQSYLATELKELVEQSQAVGDAGNADRAERIDQIQRQLLMYRFLPVHEYGKNDVICPGGLVELELNGIHSHYLLVPQGGGLVMRVDGQAVQVITPQSPLGEVLLGRRTGEAIEVKAGAGKRRYAIVGYR